MGKRILVVDDEADLTELISFNLREAGYDVEVACDGVKALTAARQKRPNLILLDLMLPELDGFAVCEILKRDPKTASIPVIMVTAWTSELSRIIGLSSGAVDYITKPFSPREMVNRVNQVLNRESPAGAGA
jgi:DNA-binding response OmpR family regulator